MGRSQEYSIHLGVGALGFPPSMTCLIGKIIGPFAADADGDMAIEIHIENHDDYHQFIGRGAFELDAFLNFLDDVLLQAKELNAARLMVDIRELEGRMSTFERFQVGERFAKQQSNLAYEAQIVVVGAEPLIDKGRFGETVARNRGANGRVFTDQEEALRWLLKDHRPN